MAKKKSARPEMTYVKSRERWRKRVIIGGRSRDVYGKTQDEVREKVRELVRQEESGMVLDDNTTLTQYAAQWFPIKTAGLKPYTVEGYRNAINKHICPFFKNTALKDIRKLHIQKFMASKRDYSRSAQNKMIGTLNQIMESALENGLIQRNPCVGVLAGGKQTEVKVPLSRQQQSILLESVRGKRVELFILLCLYAGLRREEALGLMWSNVHVDSKTPYLDVRHTVTFDVSGYPTHSDSLKSKAAYRSIPIPSILADALRFEMRNATSVFVLPAVRTGKYMSLSAFQCMWETIPPLAFHVTPHQLRHTYVTELCAAGMDIKKIQYLAGHEDVSMTLKIYAHVTQNTPEELSARIESIFLPGSGPGSDEDAKAGVSE